jgi:NAD(P)-dependent dehydrogenase (short-subunit alcohol dehydrogenase family)
MISAPTQALRPCENNDRRRAQDDPWGWTEKGSALEARFLTDILPLKVNRVGRPEDIGAAVVFLASPRADYITGAHLRIDGGLSAAAI